MSEIYFISQEYLREHTFLNANVDTKDIAPFVPTAQDIHIQDILGSTFYNYILLAYSGQSLTLDEQNLVLQIKPALAYRAAEMALPFIHMQTRNKGIQYQQGEFSSNVGLDELVYLKNEVTNLAEFYETRLLRYLKLNKALFPLYLSQQTSAQDMQPDQNATAFDAGFAADTYPTTGCSGCKGNIMF